MNLKKCLVIERIEDRASLLTVLKTTKTIMTLTIGNPVVDWADFNDGLIIYGGKREIEGVELVLGQTLGLTMNDDDVTMCPRIVTPLHRSTDEMPNVAEPVVRPASRESVRVADAVNAIVGNAPIATAASRDIPSEADIDAMATYDLLQAFSAPSDLGSTDQEGYELRRSDAEREMQMLTVNRSNTIEWTTQFNRRTVPLNPTESNSGTISREEQIQFSEERNPRRWNLAKCSYNGSRYYLSYLVPPTADIDSTLRVVGGVHDGQMPQVREICVFNTEAYWRELRHLMHRQAEYLREMAC